jgi:hypothetical protein
MTPAQKALITRLDSIGPFPTDLIHEKNLTTSCALDLACKWAGITNADLYTYSRNCDIIAQRWLVVFALRVRHLALNKTYNRGKYSIANIARLLEFHHATLLHGVRLLLEVMKIHAPNLYEFYKELEQSND